METNPWFSMWTQPRATIRSILQIDSRYGFWVLATAYALSSCFYIANVYSWGLSNTFFEVFIPLLVLSPLVGFLWLSVDGWILRYIGLKLGGAASFQEMRMALAWSKVPSFISLVMWVVLMVSGPSTAFIQYATGASAVFIVLISLIINTWSIVLLIQAVREVQGFDLRKALLNVFGGLAIFSIIALIVLYIGRYIYISYI
jgi:hypothetical protein